MNTGLNKPFWALAFALSLGAEAALADDAALYDEATPVDAVFVRVLTNGSALPSSVTFAGTRLPLGADDADVYFPISASDLKGVNAGSYYSVLNTRTRTVTIEEPARNSAAKVHLLLLNTGPEAVRLIVPGKELEVIGALASGQSASRAVNPIAVGLAVERISDGTILGTFDLNLSRGQNVTFVASETSARMIENSFGPPLKAN